MKFIADFHIHSKYSRATSKENNIPSLYKWAKIKGINLLGTGDFTHPGWLAELKENLVPDGAGLFNIRSEIKNQTDKNFASVANRTVKFILTTEISSIYKKHGKVRKIHNIIIMPDFESVEKLNKKLSSIGNIVSDGRPILGLDSKILLEIVLQINPESIFIPAHIWTPWFSLFGSNSGFDSIEECFEDLTEEIFALETGLSSDPPMNWRLSALDRFNLVSNSDAHSPQNLAREANLFDTTLSYNSIRNALKNKEGKEFIGTVEFYPEEGKYHYDGHRNCNIRFTPKEAIRNRLICPVCGKRLTVGVLHRVELLADRDENYRPKNAKQFESIVPLKEVIAEAFGMSKTSNKVNYIYEQMIEKLGDELSILRVIPIEEIRKVTTPVIAEGIRRIRDRELKILPGYDGAYGKIIIFTEEERNNNAAQMLLLAIKKKVEKPTEHKVKEANEVTPQKVIETEITPEQQEAIKLENGPIIVIAGPGTGKTWTLIERIVYLIGSRKVSPDNILAITFTNRAVNEIKNRIQTKIACEITAGTFHTIALSILRENNFKQQILDDTDTTIIIKNILKKLNIKTNVDKIKREIMLIKVRLINPDTLKDEILEKIFLEYQENIKRIDGMDYDDIIILAIKLLKSDKQLLERYRRRFQYILVDEFQDINLTEYRFIKLLAGDGRGLFIIGDPDQSIYQFRGADPELFFKLKEEFANSKIVILRKNYRNPETILKPALNLISKSSKTIKSETDIESRIKDSKTNISMILSPTDFSGYVQIAKLITAEFGGSSMQQSDIIGAKPARSFSDFAILVRAGFLIPMIEEVLVQEGIPYKIYGEKSFFERKLPRTIINLLRLWLDGFNAFRFSQIISYFDIDIKTNLSEKKDDIIKEIKKSNDFRIVEFIKIYEKCSKFSADEKPATLLKELEPIFGSNEDFKKLMLISENYKTIRDFSQLILTGKEQDIEISAEKSVKGIETVSVMTIHSAKGLQFPVVFVYGLNEEILPFKDSEVDEERRLFYVAITRAKEKLYFIVPNRIKIFGQTKNLSLSRFINDIPERFIDKKVLKFKLPKPTVEQLNLF